MDLSECAARRKASRSASARARRSVAISSRASSTNVSISSATNAPPIVAVSRSNAARSIARALARRRGRVMASASARAGRERAALERGHQLLDPDRLRHVVVHARRHAQLPVALHRVGGHGDDPRAALVPASAG